MLFQHLCMQIDDASIDHKSKAYKLAEQLIVDGEGQDFVLEAVGLLM